MERARLVERERSIGWKSFDPFDATAEEVRRDVEVLVAFLDLDYVSDGHRQRNLRDLNHVTRNDSNPSALR